MRLTNHQRRVIHEAVADSFGRDATVLLFGSRTDDTARGGDIDLLIETAMTNIDTIVRAEIALQTRLERALGTQKIDVLVDYPGRKERPPIFQEAARTGVPL